MRNNRSEDDDVQILDVASEPSSRKATKYNITYSSPISQQAVSVNCIDLPDLVAVIPFCRENRSIYLIEQLRPALFVKHGWQADIEVPAGYVDQGETPEEAAVRELSEETGTNLEAFDKTYEAFDESLRLIVGRP